MSKETILAVYKEEAIQKLNHGLNELPERFSRNDITSDKRELEDAIRNGRVGEASYRWSRLDMKLSYAVKNGTEIAQAIKKLEL